MRQLRRLLLSIAVLSVIGRAAVELFIRRWQRGEPPPPRTFGGVERSVATEDGAELRVVESGEGALIVLAHGIGGRLNHWSAVADQLVSDGYRVVAFDQRGHGSSTMGTETFTSASVGHRPVGRHREL